MGTGRGCGLVNFCGRSLSSSRTGHTPGQRFSTLGESLEDRRIDGPTYPGDERFDQPGNECACDDYSGEPAHKPRKRHIRTSPRIERLRRAERHGHTRRLLGGGHDSRHVARDHHHVHRGPHAQTVGRRTGPGLRVPPTGRSWVWNPTSHRWEHHIYDHRVKRHVRATPNYRVHHVPPPAPPGHAAHRPHLVGAPSVHHAGHWGWSPVLGKYAWIGPHNTKGAIDTSTMPPAQAGAINHLLKTMNGRHTHAETVWGVTGARELFIPGHWQHVHGVWKYVEPHADQLGRPSMQSFEQAHAPAAAYGRRPPHIAQAEFWPEPTGLMKNAYGQYPHGAPVRVMVPAHANFARQAGLLSADHIQQVRGQAWGDPVGNILEGRAMNAQRMLPGRHNLPDGQHVQLANGKVIPRWRSAVRPDGHTIGT